MVRVGNDIVVCEACGDEFVTRATSTFLTTYEGEPALYCWFRCDVCNHLWRERLVHGTTELPRTKD